MVTYALTALAVVALQLFLLDMNKSGATRSSRPALPVRHSGPYAAVSLEPAPIACDAARRFAGKRYLRDEAPSVPLRDCDGRRCGCRLVTHPDRRQFGTDRRLGVGLQSERYLTGGSHDRRAAPHGLRSSDLVGA